MIDEKKLIDELIRKDQSLQEHLKRVEDDGNELFNWGLKSQLTMLKSIISCVAKQPKTDKWILYIDRLPPEPPKVAQTKEELEEMISNGTLQEYLVTLNSGGRVTTLYYAGDSYWYDQEKELLLVVIAWKHLPESYIYKEGDNQ